jgi:hypothetical protein
MSNFHDSWIRVISRFQNLLLLDLLDNHLSLDVIIKVVDVENQSHCFMPNLSMLRVPKNISDYLIDNHVLQEEWDRGQPKISRMRKTTQSVSKMIAFFKHIKGKGFNIKSHEKGKLKTLLYSRACEERLYELMYL